MLGEARVDLGWNAEHVHPVPVLHQVEEHSLDLLDHIDDHHEIEIEHPVVFAARPTIAVPVAKHVVVAEHAPQVVVAARPAAQVVVA